MKREGCTTSILGYTSFLEYFNLNATTIGAFNSAYYGGSFVGCVINWWLPDKIGRLRTIQIACVISLIGVSLQVGAPTFPVFCTGRIIGGIACGIMFRYVSFSRISRFAANIIIQRLSNVCIRDCSSEFAWTSGRDLCVCASATGGRKLLLINISAST